MELNNNNIKPLSYTRSDSLSDIRHRLRSSGHMTNISSLLCNLVFFTFVTTALAVFAIYEYYSFFHVLLTVLILSGAYLACVFVFSIFIIREEHGT